MAEMNRKKNKMLKLNCSNFKLTAMKQTLQFLIIAILALLFSCNNNTNKKMTTSQKITIENEGVNIDYTDSKTGDTVLLLIHGWAINQTYWDKQVAYFSKNYRVITVDLPGFGKSGKNRKSWTVENYSKDIAALLTQLDIKNVILVGHSMSGAIAVETALTNPSRIIEVIGVDNFKDIGVVLTPQMQEEWTGFYSAARQNFKKSVSENMLQYLFSPSTDSIVLKKVTDDILMTDTSMAIDCLENSDKYPLAEKLKSLKKTLYLINSDFTPTYTAAFEKNNIHYSLLNIGPTGHYPMIEKPDEFNLLLQQAMAGIKNKQQEADKSKQ
jgi:pimeloyl-ACP methyl ester carboxylesterase